MAAALFIIGCAIAGFIFSSYRLANGLERPEDSISGRWGIKTRKFLSGNWGGEKWGEQKDQSED